MTPTWLWQLLLVCAVFMVRCACQRASERELEVMLGTDVVINCSLPIGARTTTWTLNGMVLLVQNRQHHYSRYSADYNDKESNLLIRNVSLDDNGQVLCQVRSNESRSVSRTTLVVLVPPASVRIHPGSITRCVAGNQTQLTCAAHNSKPPVTLTWLLDGTEVQTCTPLAANGTDQLENTTCSITVLPTRENHSQEYECVASGKSLLTPTRLRTMLDVQYAPEVELYVQPSNVALREDMSISITCAAKSNPLPELWEWRINAEKELHVNGRTFVIDRLSRRHHNASVSCIVYNAVDATKKSLILSVDYPPKFVHSTWVHKASIGEIVTLSCAVDANPPATLSWKKKDPMTGNSIDLPDFGSSAIVTMNVHASSFGEYICEATSAKFKRPYESSIFVLKKSAPITRTTSQLVYASVRGVAHIPCTIDAVPKPIITWSHNGMPLTDSMKYSFSEEEFLGGLTSILTINDVDKSDFGDYNCTSMNELGSATYRISLGRIAETNIELAIGGSAGALVALICILILSGVILHQRRARRKLKKRRQSRPRAGASKTTDIMQTGPECHFQPDFVEPLLQTQSPLPNQTDLDFPNHKCVVFGSRTLYCPGNGTFKRDTLSTTGTMRPPFDQQWLSNASIDYLQQDAADASNSQNQTSMIISMPSHCPHHAPLTSISNVPIRHEDETTATGEEAKDDSSRSFDSGYGPGSNANHPLGAHLVGSHGNPAHMHHCATLAGRYSRSQLTTPCLDSKQLVVFPQPPHPYFVPHCYSLRPHECLSNSNFSSAANSESPHATWDHDAPTSHSSSSGTLNRTSKSSNTLPAPMAMQSLCLSSNLQECDENDNGHESFNEMRSALAKDCKQSRQYASVV